MACIAYFLREVDDLFDIVVAASVRAMEKSGGLVKDWIVEHLVGGVFAIAAKKFPELWWLLRLDNDGRSSEYNHVAKVGSSLHTQCFPRVEQRWRRSDAPHR